MFGHPVKVNVLDVINRREIVIYLPVKFEFDLYKPFSSYSPETEMLTDRQTKNGQTNGITPISKGT